MAAQPEHSPLTRREMLGRLFRPFQKAVNASDADTVARTKQPGLPPPDQIAVIAGRHCLAYQGTGCSVCHDRCPVSGAIKLEQGLPRVVAEVCTGCQICHEVCPAPENAIRLVPRPPGLAKPVVSSNDTDATSAFPFLPGRSAHE